MVLVTDSPLKVLFLTSCDADERNHPAFHVDFIFPSYAKVMGKFTHINQKNYFFMLRNNPMFTQIRLLLVSALLGATILVGCAGQTANTGAEAKPAATLPAVGNGEGGGEAGGVEAALVTYSDAAQGFAIGYPGTWTQDKTVTQGVKYVGSDDSLTLEFVTPDKGMDAMTYAQNDVAAVTAAYPGFKQVDLKPSTEVKDAIILGFAAKGKSVVTGKDFTAHNERYYMPLADWRIAILTVISPDNHYDREGVRDIALTFKVTK